MADDNLEAVVKTVVAGFIAKSEPFTAIDVSNAVKESLPKTRHREVSPIVRSAYASGDMGNYERTTIKVKLADNSDANTYLYHPLEDTWDLDSKYGDTKRAQTATPVKQVDALNDHVITPDVVAAANASPVKSSKSKKKTTDTKTQRPLPPTIWADVAADFVSKLWGIRL